MINSLASLNTRVETLEQQMSSSKAIIDTVIDIKLDKKLKEFEDKEKGKCNLVKFGIEESHNTEPAGTRDDDISSVSSICNKLRFDVSKSHLNYDTKQTTKRKKQAIEDNNVW